jgi:hypothetical protein
MVAEAHPMALRVRVLADCDAGPGTAATAKEFRVSPAWVRRLKHRRRERGGDITSPRGPAAGRAPHGRRSTAPSWPAW